MAEFIVMEVQVAQDGTVGNVLTTGGYVIESKCYRHESEEA